MLRCIGRIVTIFALCCSIGFQWLALQSVAWTTMLISNAKRTTLCEAVAQTFDGAHPCSLCRVVNKGSTSEKKSDLQPLKPKIDIVCLARTILLRPPFARFAYPIISLSTSDHEHRPLIPPPRFC